MTTEKDSAATNGKRYHHGNLRDALIIAAAESIEESGSDDFAMIDAARRAGVSSAAPYRHFKDRDDLLEAVGELGFFDLTAQLLAIQAQHKTGSIEGIIELGKCYIRFVTTHPAFFDLMWGERGALAMQDLNEEQAQIRTRGLQLLVNEIQSWCEQENIPDRDPWDLALKLWAMGIGLSHLQINHSLQRYIANADTLQMLETSTHAFLRGVKATASSQ